LLAWQYSLFDGHFEIYLDLKRHIKQDYRFPASSLRHKDTLPYPVTLTLCLPLLNMEHIARKLGIDIPE